MIKIQTRASVPHICKDAPWRLLSAARAILLSCLPVILQGCGDGATNSESMKFAVMLEDVVKIPASSETPPRARINFLFHAADGSGRVFVNDMTGKIYVIKDRHVLPEPFLDMAIARQGRFTSRDLFEQGLNTFAFHPDFATRDRPGSGKFYTSAPKSQGPESLTSPAPTQREALLIMTS